MDLQQKTNVGVLLVLLSGYCSAQKMPVFYYHHQIPIKIVHGYELKPIYNDKPTQIIPLNSHPHPQRPVYHTVYARPVGVQMPPIQGPTPLTLDQQKRAYLSLYNKRPGIHSALHGFQPSPIDQGFKPIIKPSVATLNDHSVESDPHNYGYVRNYVEQLKQRQKEHFNANPEIDYFTQREHEIGGQHEEATPPQSNYQPPPTQQHVYKVTDDTIDDDSDDKRSGYKAQSEEESSYGHENQEETASDEDEYKGNHHKYHNEHHEASHEQADEPYRVSFGNHHYEKDPFDDEETKKLETSVTPIKLYSQTRHTERNRKLPKPTDEPRIREKLTTGKTHIHYKEEGYDDDNYDHLDAEKSGEGESTKKKRKKYNKSSRYSTTAAPSRSKRDISDNSIDKAGPPEAAALTQKSGEELLKHLSEVIKNSSIYDDMLPEGSSHEIIRLDPKHVTAYSLDQLATPTEGFFGIADSKINSYVRPNDLNKSYKSLYRSKLAVRCAADEIPNLTEDSFNGKVKKRGGQLGDKLDCLKVKYFGKQPFDEPFFKDKSFNVSDVVYDDIMRHINGSGRKSNVKKRKASITSYTVSKGVAHEGVNSVLKDKSRQPLNQKKPPVQASASAADEVFSPLVFPTSTTENYDIPSFSALPLRKDVNKIYSAIFDINHYYPKAQSSAPLLAPTTAATWTQVSFTTIRPPASEKSSPKVHLRQHLSNAAEQVSHHLRPHHHHQLHSEQVPQHSRPFRAFRRPPKRWYSVVGKRLNG